VPTVMIDVEDLDEGIVEGIITAQVDRGLLVTLDDGTRGFLPSSQVDVRPVRDLHPLIGERHRFKIIKFKKGESKVLSRRVLLEQDRAAERGQTLALIEEGKIVEGVVAVVLTYGALVDLGGIDGLLLTDRMPPMAGQSAEPLLLGDRVRVRISKVDRETERIELTLIASDERVG